MRTKLMVSLFAGTAIAAATAAVALGTDGMDRASPEDRITTVEGDLWVAHSPPGVLGPDGVDRLTFVPMCFPDSGGLGYCETKGTLFTRDIGTGVFKETPLERSQSGIVEATIASESGLGVQYYAVFSTLGGVTMSLPRGGARAPYVVPSSGAETVVSVPSAANLAVAVGDNIVQLPYGDVNGVQIDAPTGEGAAAGPTDFAVAPDGTVAIVDDLNDRVVMVHVDGTQSTTDLAGLQQTAADFDQSGNLYVASDAGIERIGPDGTHTLEPLERPAGIAVSRLIAEGGVLVDGPGETLIGTGTSTDGDRNLTTVDDETEVKVDVRRGYGELVAVSGERTLWSVAIHDERQIRGIYPVAELSDGRYATVMVVGDDSGTELRLVAVDPALGATSFAVLEADGRYLMNGPVFKYVGDTLYVMSSAADGLVITQYDLNNLKVEIPS